MIDHTIVRKAGRVSRSRTTNSSKLLEIIGDACLQGTKNITLWSRLSESGFVALGRLSAAKRFESFVADLHELDASQFGTIFARDNEGHINNYNRHSGKVACTFRDITKTGKCKYNGLAFNVTGFKLEKNSRYYEFCTTGQHCSINNNDYNKEMLTNDDVPGWRNAQVDDKRREHLYKHTQAAGMFHFGVSFDRIEQTRYSTPGQGEHMSKVLHWDITRSQLIGDLSEKGFEFGNIQAGDLKAFKVNATAFEGFPSRFAQEYQRTVSREAGNRDEYAVLELAFVGGEPEKHLFGRAEKRTLLVDHGTQEVEHPISSRY